jgi:putative transposase
MTHHPNLPNRHSHRLRDYDYSQAGAYFLTLCLQDRICRFGDVVDGKVRLSSAGEMIDRIWRQMPVRFPSIVLDDWVVMPNHFHGIIILSDLTHPRAETSSAPMISRVIQAYKSETANTYSQGVRELGWPAFIGRLWQRDYYDHIIRDEPDLDRIREYIALNPSRWEEDRENPNNRRT